MELIKRAVVFATFVLFAAGISLISAALATDFWISAKPVRANSSFPGEPAADFGSEIHFGLFNGIRKLNYGLGTRPAPFNVRDELKTGVGFMSVGLWVAIIVFAALAMMWAVIGVVFSLINTVIVPYETLTGPLGLYLWSSLAVLCTFLSAILFIVQYFQGIAENVLLKDQLAAGWTTNGLASFEYSFWLMIGALGSFGLVIFLLLLSGIEVKRNFAEIKSKANAIDGGGAFMY